VAVNTEISVLWDQITSLKREYGLRTFDLMADPEANKEALVEVFQELNAKIAPKVQKWNEKHARKQVLTGEPAPIPVAEVSANQENETNANDADAPPVHIPLLAV